MPQPEPLPRLLKVAELTFLTIRRCNGLSAAIRLDEAGCSCSADLKAGDVTDDNDDVDFSMFSDDTDVCSDK